MDKIVIHMSKWFRPPSYWGCNPAICLGEIAIDLRKCLQTVGRTDDARRTPDDGMYELKNDEMKLVTM